MKRLLNYFNSAFRPENTLITMFFVFLAISLFLGDGKQPLIDIFAAVNISALAIYTLLTQRAKHTLPPKMQMAWVLLIGYYVIRSIFSDSVGYSVSTTLRLLMAYVTFYLFYCYINRNQLLHFTNYLIGLCVFAIGGAFLFIIFPRLTINVPATNLLYATYGHNHLASLLLFGLPLIVSRLTQKLTILNLILFTLFLVGFIFSLGRGVFFLLMFYFGYLYFKSIKTQTLGKRLFYLGFTALFGVVLAITFFLTAQPANPTTTKNFSWLQRQLYKPGLLTARSGYWQQAWDGFKTDPFFGHGPGTFYLLSKRFQNAPNSYSYFAHSWPLETLSETGLVGIALWSLLLFLIAKQLTNLHNSHLTTYNKSQLFIGVILTFLYSFFDFNLNFIVIWLLFWAMIGSLSTEPVKNDYISSAPLFLKFSIAFITIFYLLSGSGLILSKTQAPRQKMWMFYLAPFDAQFTLTYLQALSRSSPQNERADRQFLELEAVKETNKMRLNQRLAIFFHRNNPDMYVALTALPIHEDEKQRRKEISVSLDPWKRNEYNVVEYYIQRREWDRAQQELKKTLYMWAEAKRIRGYEADYAKKQELSKQMLVTGDGLFIEKKPTEAAAWYVQAQKVDAWALAAHRPVFLDYPLSNKEKTDFFQGLGKTQGEYLGWYKEDYTREYLLTLKEAARDYTITDFFPHAEAIVRLDPWIHSRVWDGVGFSLLEKAKEEKKSHRYQEALAVLLEGVSFWKTLTNGGQQVDWRLQHDFAEELVFVGNLLAPSQLPLTAQAYQSAKLLVPWILSGKEPWFEEYAPEKIEVGSLISYISSTATGDEWEKTSRAYAVLFLVDKAASDKDTTPTAGYVKQLKDVSSVSSVDYVFREKIIKKLQKLADQLLLDKKIDAAENTILIMNKVFPEDYWVQAQLGHFYTNTGNIDAAKQAYKDCLSAQSSRHDDCFYGLQALEAGQPNTDRYQQVSQIIQGTASWRDF